MTATGRWRLPILLAAGLLVLAGCDGGGANSHRSGASPSAPPSSGQSAPLPMSSSSASAPASSTPSAQVIGPAVSARGTWTLDLPDRAAHTIRVISAPAGDHHVVAVGSTGGAARLAVHGHTAAVRLPPGAIDVTVRIDARQAWRLQVGRAAPAVTIDARHFAVRGVALTGAVGRFTISAGAAHGPVPLAVRAPVTVLTVHLPEGTTVQARLGGGADSATIYGARHDAVRAGTTLATPSAAPDYYRIDDPVALGSLTVDSAPS